MKKLKIILLILILISLVEAIIPIMVQALDNPNNYKPKPLTRFEVGEFAQYGGKVAGIIQVIGTIVSVGAMIIIGIKYVMATAEDKAEYKEKALPYLIGLFLLFGASNLVNIIYKIVE